MTTGARALTAVIAVAVAVVLAVLPHVAAGGHRSGAPIASSEPISTADSLEIAAIGYVPDATDQSLVSHVDVELAGTLQPRTQVDLRLSPSGSWYRCSILGTAVSGVPHPSSLRCIPDGEMTSSSRVRQVTVMLSAS